MSDSRSLDQILGDCRRRFVEGRLRQAAGRTAQVAPQPEPRPVYPDNPTIPPSFRWATLEAPELRHRVASERAIAEARTALSSEAGLLLFGSSGSGKTSLACALLRAWEVRKRPDRGLFVPAFRLAVARTQHALGQGEAPLIHRAMTTRRLVLDDLGSESSVHGNAVPEVIHERAMAGLPTWVTTWMTPQAVAQRYGDGIARRLYEAGRTVVVSCEKK